MTALLQFFILLPLVGFLLTLVIPRKKERLLSGIAIGTVTLQLVAMLLFFGYWLWQGRPVLDSQHAVLYEGSNFRFMINFYFDITTAVYAMVGVMIIFMVTVFSRFYLHRESGFKRFFNTLLLFFLGYNLITFSGNLETLFIGWEILGFCSFLLIAFYRDRYLPVKNGLKVISIYRLGDVCLILAMWMSHHLFHENITFIRLSEAVNTALLNPSYNSLFIFTAVMILVAALAKSALLPFSSWLPRAMEGPTTSSAVFYGSLSVHMGAFLLIRTYPLWQHLLGFKILIIVIGTVSALIATSIASVQSTVKTQIAYASITQMGLIFIEVALGWHILALVHFSGNAFLRTYQLLVSPSVLNYKIHDMFFNYTPVPHALPKSNFQGIKNTLYVLSLKEWSLDNWLKRLLWDPFKWTGKKIHFLGGKAGLVVLGIILFGGVYYLTAKTSPQRLDEVMTIVISVIGLLLVLKAFAERGSALKAWLLVGFGQCFICLAIALNGDMPLHQVFLFLGAILVALIVGYICLMQIKKIDNDVMLDRFHGYTYEKPLTAFVFLLCCLAFVGFPFTPTFLGIDLLFTHIHANQFILVIVIALNFIFIEMALLRLYARIFLGPHKKPYHPIAFRST